MVNISWFSHDHRGISTKKSIQLRLKLLKKKKNTTIYLIALQRNGLPLGYWNKLIICT